MKKGLFLTGVLGFIVFAGSVAHAEKWVKKDLSDKIVAANYEDADSVKENKGTISWTEKYELTESGAKNYSKHLSQFKGCKEAMEKKGEVTQHQIDFEISKGKFRKVAKRNFNKKNELVCTDKDMGKDLDTRWHHIGRRSPIEDTYYRLVSKYKLKDQ